MHYDEPIQEAQINLTIVPPPVVPEHLSERLPPVIQSHKPEKVVETPKPEKIIQPPKMEKLVELPEKTLPITTQAERVAPVAVTVPKQSVIPESVVPTVQKSNGVAEGLFTQDVRSRIERKKIYPDRARELGMSGEVEVLYELSRSGKLIRAEIVASSGYPLLDQAALKAVKLASYTSFPEDAWLGENSKTFRTKLVFSINQ